MNAPDPFSPLALGPLRLRNRFIKSATNEGMARGGVPSQALVEHHRRIAAGGAALTTVAYCAVERDGRTFEDQLTLDHATIAPLRVLTDAVHRHQGAASAQLTHGGAFSFLPRYEHTGPLSASGGFNPPGFISGRLRKHAMDAAQRERIAAAFAQAARHAREAGFDAVELHMGHGYLLSQFLSPAHNRRRDEYGGDAQGRARFPVQVLERVLDAVGRDLAVICKLSIVEGHARGASMHDVLVTCRALQAAGAHLLVLSGGMNAESPWQIFGSNLPLPAPEAKLPPRMHLGMRLMKLSAPKVSFRELYLRDHALQVRGAVTQPLAYLGGVTSLHGVRQVLTDGFDAVVMGRALLHDPELIAKFHDGRAQASGCTACNRCVSSMYTAPGTHCALHPTPDAALNQRPARAA